MRVRSLVAGASTFLPPMRKRRMRGTGGTLAGKYGYSVWLRHRVIAYDHGCAEAPDVVIELGPGESVAVLLAALISGASVCYAADVVRLLRPEAVLPAFDEIVALFRRRAPVPGPDEFSRVKPVLASYAFPHRVFDSSRLDQALAGGRLARLRACLARDPERGPINYIAPWGPDDIPRGSADFVCSQAVLECADDLDALYRVTSSWLRPGGWTSHQIDLSGSEFSSTWYEQWTTPEALWAVAKGCRPFWLNREPLSTYLRLNERHGFEALVIQTTRAPSSPDRRVLQPQFARLTDEDLRTMDVLIQCRKPHSASAADA